MSRGPPSGAILAAGPFLFGYAGEKKGAADALPTPAPCRHAHAPCAGRVVPEMSVTEWTGAAIPARADAGGLVLQGKSSGAGCVVPCARLSGSRVRKPRLPWRNCGPGSDRPAARLLGYRKLSLCPSRVELPADMRSPDCQNRCMRLRCPEGWDVRGMWGVWVSVGSSVRVCVEEPQV